MNRYPKPPTVEIRVWLTPDHLVMLYELCAEQHMSPAEAVYDLLAYALERHGSVPCTDTCIVVGVKHDWHSHSDCERGIV